MTAAYKIFGAELSPYSVKVRAYFRYKRLPYQWRGRSGADGELFKTHAKLPLIPLVLTPEGEALQDSTPIIETLEARFPEPSIHPPSVALAFLSALAEEWADEWGNKWMFHYRWRRRLDQEVAARRIARSSVPQLDEPQLDAVAEQIRQRMTARLGFVGSSDANAEFIESDFLAALGRLDAHLSARAYLFGARPSFADFALWGQLYNCWTDPTPGALLESRAPAVLEWIHRMSNPHAEGPFEDWGSLEATWSPVLRDDIASRFLTWSAANEAAINAGASDMEVRLGEFQWRQQPQKYHARSLSALRAKYRGAAQDPLLDRILQRSGASAVLAAEPPPK